MEGFRIGRVALSTQCQRVAEGHGHAFVVAHRSDQGGRQVYVIDGADFTPGEAMEWLNARYAAGIRIGAEGVL